MAKCCGLSSPNLRGERNVIAVNCIHLCPTYGYSEIWSILGSGCLALGSGGYLKHPQKRLSWYKGPELREETSDGWQIGQQLH